MSRGVHEGCIASCVRYFLLPDRTHTGRLLRSTPHFCLCYLLHVNPVRSRFRHLHVVHGLSYPLARLSLRLTVTLCGVVCNLLIHSLHRMIYISAFSLQGVVHIESGPHWFPVFFPF